jgi:hypothetical protein
MHHGVSPNSVPKEALGLRHDELEVVHILQQLGRAAPRYDDVGRRPQATKVYCRTAMSSDPCTAAEHEWSRRWLIRAQRPSTSIGGDSTPCGTVDVEDEVAGAEAAEPAASSIAVGRTNRATTSI